MADDATTRKDPTRRDYVKYASAIVAGGTLAGCTETLSGSGEDPANGDSTEGSESYTASISPVGEITFDEVPTNVMAYSPHYADMLVALGHEDALNSLGYVDDYVTGLEYFFDAFDGVSLSADGLKQLFDEGMDKEIFYELESDVHLMDPAWASTFEGWSKADTEEIEENVGPWFGNRYSREHTQPPEEWRDGYRFYTLWELVGRVADVFQERERFEALREEYERMYGEIRANLPDQDERPTVGLVAFWEGEFSPYKINGSGFGRAHTDPFGARDVFAESDRTYDENYGAAYDFEGMLEYDPDVILHNMGVTPNYDWDEIKETVEDDPVGKELTAVQNDRFYASGQPFQGPLQNLLQIEMTAKQLYPEQFGEWPGYEEGDSYPDFDEDEQLFDHQRIADIINGEF